MKHQEKYDPEDIESLLKNKQFYELYPEEREFVLKHMEDEHEYNRMRRLLLEIQEISASDDLLNPDASIRKNLLYELRKEKKSRFVIWLNAVFAAPEIPWWKQSGVRVSFGVLILLLGVGSILLLNDNNPIVLAENKQSENPQTEEVLDSLAKDESNGENSEPNQPVEISTDEVQISEVPAPVALADVEVVQEEKVSIAQSDEPSAGAPQTSAEIADNYKAESDQKMTLNSIETTSSTSPAREMVSFNETAKKPKSNSPSEDGSVVLNEHSDLIGLLFTAR